MTSISHCPQLRPSRNPAIRRPRCLLSFDEHLARTEAFALEAGRMPLQRRCAKVGLREEHLGQWVRSILTKARVGSSTLQEAQLRAVLNLMSRFPQKHESYGPQLRGVTDHDRMMLVLEFRQSHQGRLPRVFGGEDDPAERIAGHALTQLRTRYRGSRRNVEDRIDPVVLEKLDVYCRGWADVHRDAPRRRVRRYRRPEHAALLALGRVAQEESA